MNEGFLRDFFYLPAAAKPGTEISLRDYFAAHAMAGMQARDAYDAGQATPEQRAHLAYVEADAMIAERSTPIRKAKARV